MSISKSRSSEALRKVSPGESIRQKGISTPIENNSTAKEWNSGTTQHKDDNTESSTCVGSPSEDTSSESSSSSSRSPYELEKNAAQKMSPVNLEDKPAENNAMRSRQTVTKFCLAGVGTSLGFTAAVAGFVATTFLYDLVTRYPEKVSTEIAVAFGAAIAIALSGTVTCSTSMVFLVKELCETNPA